MKTALVIGANGQDGSYLCDILLARGYQVHGTVRRTSFPNTHRIKHLLVPDENSPVPFPHTFTLHLADLSDGQSIHRLLWKHKPDEVYNVADQDHVGTSSVLPAYNVDVTFGAVVRLLESVSMCCPDAKVFQPASATMFGDAPAPQDETTVPNPLSPYAVCKTAAYHYARYARRAKGLNVWTAILYNHDSPRRGPDYLLQRMAKAAVLIAAGRQKTFELDHLDTVVDIGYARDYMEGVVTMLEKSEPEDFVFASDQQPCWDVRTLWAWCCLCAGVRSAPKDFTTPSVWVKNGPPPTLVGQIGKAFSAFGFSPQTTSDELIRTIVTEWKLRLDRGEI